MAGVTITVDIKQFNKLLTKLGANAPTALKAGLFSASMRARVIVDQESVRKRVMNTGYYRRAWKTFAMFEEHAVRVYNVAPYAGVVEYGRRPGGRMPPVRPIARWAERKFGIPYEEALGISFGIAKKIQKAGIPGKHVLTDALPTLSRAFEQEIQRELRAMLNRVRP